MQYSIGDLKVVDYYFGVASQVSANNRVLSILLSADYPASNRDFNFKNISDGGIYGGTIRTDGSIITTSVLPVGAYEISISW